jgi:hypothetical protein
MQSLNEKIETLKHSDEKIEQIIEIKVKKQNEVIFKEIKDMQNNLKVIIKSV